LIRVEASGSTSSKFIFAKACTRLRCLLFQAARQRATVEELGPGVTGFAAGDAVASASVLCSYAEYALVPARNW